MAVMRIAVLVSGNGTNLQALIDAERRGENPHGEIVMVISSNMKAYALERARLAQIPALVVDKKTAPSADMFERRLFALLYDSRIDLVVLAGFLHILSPQFISMAPFPIINIHPALLPDFGGPGYYGLKVHQAVLEAGVKMSGATVHYVNEVPDGGAIIRQKQVPVLPDDTPETLQQRVMEQAEWQLLPQAVREICQQMNESEA